MAIFNSYVKIPEDNMVILYYGYDMTSHCLVYYTMVMMGKKGEYWWSLEDIIPLYGGYYPIIMIYNDDIHHIMG